MLTLTSANVRENDSLKNTAFQDFAWDTWPYPKVFTIQSIYIDRFFLPSIMQNNTSE